MMFAGRLGASLTTSGSEADVLAQLFNEELGAVLQVADSKLTEVMTVVRKHNTDAHAIGSVEAGDSLTVSRDGDVVLQLDRIGMQREWSETSYRLQSLRDNPETAREEYERILDGDDPGLSVHLNFDPSEDIAAPFVGGARPRVAILREQGVNSQYEMAAAFMHAGFAAVDVHMSDLLNGDDNLATLENEALLEHYEELEIRAIASEYHEGLRLVRGETERPKLIAWLGSTIGNLRRDFGGRAGPEYRDAYTPATQRSRVGHGN
jgi:phosphoribosylformylglycinamidine synthase